MPFPSRACPLHLASQTPDDALPPDGDQHPQPLLAAARLVGAPLARMASRQTGINILGGADVVRAVGAAQDVTERHGDDEAIVRGSVASR